MTAVEPVMERDASSRMEWPPLVIVGGSPASGKTSLARDLTGALRLPLLSKDGFKETLFDTLGAPSREQTRTFGLAAYELIYMVTGLLVDAGVGAILESNFNRGRSELELRPLVRRSRAVQIHCGTTPEETIRRYTERTERGERHPGHHDKDALPSLMSNLAAGLFEPLDLEIPTILVDTTHDYEPDVAEILRQVRAAIDL